MTDTTSHDTAAGAGSRDARRDQPQHIVDVPNSINMVSLLGPRDEHLAQMEKAFAADVHVRGNRITLTGAPADVAVAQRALATTHDAVRIARLQQEEWVGREVQLAVHEVVG